MEFSWVINYFISLFILCSPLTALPVFLSLTQGRAKQQRTFIGFSSGMAVAVILTIATWIGAPLLEFLGISVPAFQCAGAIVVFLLALSMLNAKVSSMRQTEDELKAKASIAVVPLAMPIMSGPGALSAVIVASNVYHTILQKFILTGCALLVGITTALLFYFGVQIERYLGETGLNIITRIGGLILAALAFEIFSKGLKGLFW
ncbi:MAG: NAAT family transporter [Chlamydiales bacterium]|nr:NAAT family transporter [Chlamydiales bacterium]